VKQKNKSFFFCFSYTSFLGSSGDVGRDERRRKTLLQLLRLLGIVEDEGVQVAMAANLELYGVGAFGWLLNSGSLSIIPLAQLKKLLDIVNLFRHVDGCGCFFANAFLPVRFALASSLLHSSRNCLIS